LAKQEGHMQTRGTLNGLNYYRAADGTFKVRRRAKFDGQRLLTDPTFEMVRQNMSEFRKTANAGKVLRDELGTTLRNVADGTITARLFSVISKIVKSDPVSLRGQRSAMKGNQSLLKGFEFNSKSSLGSVLIAKFVSTIDRVTGQVVLAIPAIIPANNIFWPAGATHCKISSVGVALDFETGQSESAGAFTANIPFGRVEVPAINLVSQLEANSTKVLIHAVGIEFLMITNGVEYPMQNKAFNSMGIVEVNPIVV
jgi:hypothetical protein